MFMRSLSALISEGVNIACKAPLESHKCRTLALLRGRIKALLRRLSLAVSGSQWAAFRTASTKASCSWPSSVYSSLTVVLIAKVTSERYAEREKALGDHSIIHESTAKQRTQVTRLRPSTVKGFLDPPACLPAPGWLTRSRWHTSSALALGIGRRAAKKRSVYLGELISQKRSLEEGLPSYRCSRRTSSSWRRR